MRKFLRQKFWSQGTSLGSLGPLSQGDVLIGFHRLQFLVMWGPYNYPGIGASKAHAKTPKFFPRQCDTYLVVSNKRPTIKNAEISTTKA